MKKWFSIGICILFLLVLTGCNTYDISKILFIASVGIEKKGDSYQGYFYLPLSSDIGKTETTENSGKGEFAKIEGKTIQELFTNIQATTSLNMNFRHVSSIVLQEELLNKDFLVELCDYIKFSLDIDFNCYLFVTTEKLEELYDFENPNKESVLNSLLVSSNDTSSLLLSAQPMHFLKFACDFYDERSILFPLLVLEELWTIESEPVKSFHAQSSVFYYKDKVKEVKDHPSSLYFSAETAFFDRIDEVPIYLTHYKTKKDFKDRLYFTVECSYEIFSSQHEVNREKIQSHIYSRIKEYIQEFEEMDPLNLAYYNQAYGTSCSYETMDIQIILHIN